MYSLLSREKFNNLNQFNGAVDVIKLFDELFKTDSFYYRKFNAIGFKTSNAFYWNIIVTYLI